MWWPDGEARIGRRIHRVALVVACVAMLPGCVHMAREEQRQRDEAQKLERQNTNWPPAPAH